MTKSLLGLTLALAIVSAVGHAQTATELLQQADQRRPLALQLDAQGSVPGRPGMAGLGTVEGQRYTHVKTGMTLQVPDNWQYRGTGPSSDEGEMVLFESRSPAAQVYVWVIKEANTAEDVVRRLQEAPIEKVGARHAQGYLRYEIPRDSVQSTTIGGRFATVATANYPDQQSGAPMREYLTWIYTEHSRAFFFSRVPQGDYAKLKPQIDELVASAFIP